MSDVLTVLAKLEGDSRDLLIEVDRATKSVEDMERTTDSATKGATSSWEKMSGGIGKAVGVSVGVIAGLGVAAGAAVAGMWKLAQQASDLGEAQNVVNATFGEGSAAINAWAADIENTAGIGQTAATSMVGSMGAMLKSMGTAPNVAADMSESLVKLTGDMSSFYNLGHEEAWTAIRSGIAGETEPLKRLGINMSQANLEAFALTQGISKTMQEMSSAEQTQLRYAYLMQVTADAQGDFSNTLSSLSNQTRLMETNMANLGTTLGGLSIPAFSEGLIGMNGALGALNVALQQSGGDADKMGAAFEAAFSGIVESAAPMVEEVLDIAGSLVNGLIKGLVKAAPKILDAAGGLIGNLLTGIAQSAPLLVQAAVPAVMNLATGILQQIPLLLNAGLNIVIGLIQGITQAIPTLIPAIVNVVTNIVSVLLQSLPALVNAALQLLSALAQGLVDAIPVVVDAVTTLIPEIIETVVGMIPDLIDAGLALFLGLLDGLLQALPVIIDGIVNMIPKLIETVVGMIPDMIEGAIKFFIGIIMALVKALPQIIQAVVDAIPRIIMALVDAIPDMISGAIDLFLGIVMGLIEALPEIIKAVIEAIPKIIEAIVKAVPKMADAGWKLIKGLIDGFIDGISRLWDTVYNAVVGFFGDVWDGVLGFFGIHSPSKVAAEAGGFIVKGLIKGIESMTNALDDSVMNMAAVVADGMLLGPVATVQGQVDATIGSFTAPSIAPLSATVSSVPTYRDGSSDEEEGTSGDRKVELHIHNPVVRDLVEDTREAAGVARTEGLVP